MLEVLKRIYHQGVVHGDVEPCHVVVSSLHTLAKPKWIDFIGACNREQQRVDR